MKKRWIVLLAATIVASSIVGAQSVLARSHSGSSASAVPKIPHCTASGTVTYMYWGDSGDNAAHKSSIAVAEKKCKGLHVSPIWDSGNYDTDLATKIGSGNAPDLFQLDASKRIPQYVTQGALAPMDTFVKQQKMNLREIYWAQCVNELTYKGHVYGLPRTCSNQSLLFYNKEMFQAKGVAFPTNNWTYTDMAQAAQKLSGTYSVPHDQTSQLRFGMAFNTDDFRAQQFMWGWGGDWLNSKLNRCTMTSPPARAGLQFLHDIAYKYHGMPTASQASGLPDYFGGFQKERYAMAFMGPWALNYAFGKKPGGQAQINFNWGAVLTPKWAEVSPGGDGLDGAGDLQEVEAQECGILAGSLRQRGHRRDRDRRLRRRHAGSEGALDRPRPLSRSTGSRSSPRSGRATSPAVTRSSCRSTTSSGTSSAPTCSPSGRTRRRSGRDIESLRRRHQPGAAGARHSSLPSGGPRARGPPDGSSSGA